MFRGALTALGGLAAGMLLAPRTAQAQQRVTLADLQTQLNALTQRNADLEADVAELAMQSNAAPVIWSGCSLSNGQVNNGWLRYPLTNTEFNTAQGYLNVQSSGIVQVLKSGFYRINFKTKSQSGLTPTYFGARVMLNGSYIHVGFIQAPASTETHHYHDLTYGFDVDDEVSIECYSSQAQATAFYGGSAVGRLQLTYAGPLPS